MSISGISQWFVTNVGGHFNSFDPWRMGIAMAVISLTVPIFINFRRNYCKKIEIPGVSNISSVERSQPCPTTERSEPFHTWVTDGREIHFSIENQKIQMEVIRISDRMKLFKGHVLLSPVYDRLPLMIKKTCVKNEFEHAGWKDERTPLFTISKTEILHTWILDGGSLSLLSKDERLIWKFDENRVTYWTQDIRPQGTSKDQRVDKILNVDEPIKWDIQAKFPHMFKKFVNPIKSTLGERVIRLVIRGPEQELMWEFVNRALKITSWSLVHPELFKNYSNCERLAHLQYQEIAPSSILSSKKIERLVLVVKSTMPSKVDPQISLNNDTWAITLLDTGTCSRDLTTWGGHAVIAVEGIEENLPFIQLIDLVPDGKGKAHIEIREHNPRVAIIYSGKTPTFSIGKYKVRKMMENIRKERDETKNSPIPFNFRGIDAFRITKKPAHNCISWARKQLAIAGIEMAPGLIALVVNYPKQYTVPCLVEGV